MPKGMKKSGKSLFEIEREKQKKQKAKDKAKKPAAKKKTKTQELAEKSKSTTKVRPKGGLLGDTTDKAIERKKKLKEI